MSLSTLRDGFPDYARDIKLNLGTVLGSEGAPGLTPQQQWGVALTAAYASGVNSLIEAILAEASLTLGDLERDAARAASAIMAMNNIYYRFMHHTQSKEVKALPARLRMNVIGKPGISKLDFELNCLGASIINGCEACCHAHTEEAFKGGISAEGVQSVARIAAVVFAAAQVVGTRLG